MNPSGLGFWTKIRNQSDGDSDSAAIYFKLT